MFRFTIRDVRWLTVVVGMAVGWWTEHRKSIALARERDDATVQWHVASTKWLQATKLVPPSQNNRGIGGGMAAPLPASDEN